MTTCTGNERRLYDKLLLHPHENILTVYGICTDAPDGKVRLVMKLCEKGSLDDYLAGTAKHEVCFALAVISSLLSLLCCCLPGCLPMLACAFTA